MEEARESGVARELDRKLIADLRRHLEEDEKKQRERLQSAQAQARRWAADAELQELGQKSDTPIILCAMRKSALFDVHGVPEAPTELTMDRLFEEGSEKTEDYWPELVIGFRNCKPDMWTPLGWVSRTLIGSGVVAIQLWHPEIKIVATDSIKFRPGLRAHARTVSSLGLYSLPSQHQDLQEC